MTHAKLLHHRLHNQRLAATTFEDPAESVRWLGAVQAQDYLGALWAIGLRTRSATERLVERAIAEGTIVRTWPMRGTMHFVAAEDARWMLELTTPRVVAAGTGRLEREYGLDEKVFGRSGEVLARALEGGRRLTRDAMYRTLESAGISTAGGRWLRITWRIAHDGLICFGPREGNGRVAGTWTRELGKRSVEVDLSPFTRLGTTAGRAVAAATRRYAAFLGRSADAS